MKAAQKPLLQHDHQLKAVAVSSSDQTTSLFGSDEFHRSMRWSIVAGKVNACLSDRLLFVSGLAFVYAILGVYYTIQGLILDPNPTLVTKVMAQCSQVAGGLASNCGAIEVVVDEQRYSCPPTLSLPSPGFLQALHTCAIGFSSYTIFPTQNFILLVPLPCYLTGFIIAFAFKNCNP
jgi:hypothetical protein